MSSTDFDTFFAARAEAAKAYVVGDGSAVDELVPHEGKASFFSPLGDVVTGANSVTRRYLHDSEAFHPEGTTRFKVLHKGQSGDLAFCKDMRSRVTEIFRRIGGTWKLVRRHADHQEVSVRTPPTRN